MKIIIVGCGKIGFSHLKSFFNSKNIYEIDLIDNKNRLNHIKKLLINKKNLQLNYRDQIPRNKKFDFAIISTNSKERYDVFKKLISKNKIKFFIFEKFIFSKISEYKKFNKLYYNYYNQIMVNSIGSYIFLKCNIKKNKKDSVNIVIKIKEGTLFTSMIHFFDFFYLLTNQKFKIDFSKITKIIKSKRPNYHEGLGEISAKNSNGTLKIITSKNTI